MSALDPGSQSNFRLGATRFLGSPAGIVLLIGAVACLDLATSWEVPLGLFYLLPICLVAYHHTFRRVTATVFLSVLAWSLVDVLAHRPVMHSWTPWANLVVRMVTLGGMGWFVHRARSTQLRERDLVQFVVHDLRSPVTVLGLALDQMAESGPHERGLAQCRHALNRMNSLIESLLTLTRLERGQMPIRREDFSVQAVLTSAICTLQPMAELRRITIEVPKAPLDCLALGDPALTQRVLENLLGNAAKVTPDGKCIRVACEHKTSGDLIIRIQDEGPGIPVHQARRIFEPYVQLELGRVNRTAGHGLGLAFCRAAVQGMGGHIWVESCQGAGTTLAVALPAGAVPTPAPTPLEEPTATGACPNMTHTLDLALAHMPS